MWVSKFSRNMRGLDMRSLIVLSNAGVLKDPATPTTARGQFSNMRLFAAFCLSKSCRAATCLCLAYLCYDSAPGGESLLLDKRHRAKLPEYLTLSLLLGQSVLSING